MASQGASGSLVESLAEAEQLLVNRSGSSSCGNNSAVASEERDSIVEATAVIEHLERSSNIDTRSEVGSDGSGPRPRQTATSSLVSGDSSGDRVAAFQADETDPSKSSTLQLLQDTRAAKEEADARLLSAERMIEQLEVTKQKELEQMKEKIDDVQIDAAKSLLIQKRRLNQEMVVMKQQLLTSEQQEENAKEKKDVVVRCLASMQETHAKEISNLKVQIDPSQIAAKCEENVRVDLNNAHVENRAMLSELTELRMKMLEKEQARENEVSDLKTMLEVARLREETLEQEASVSSIPSCRSRLLTMVSGTRRRNRCSPRRPLVLW
ncbi:unnamed protein product [Prorocentrum cordatum]|uniref:Uncharacterized protein n=1 Tax=Prorocentrum cordatum TaxID=2364126 RepID=A0ABN9SUC1_9DINO|nr:unnamed protein product [Polarella glacialis]